MKKLLALSLAVLSVGFIASPAEATTSKLPTEIVAVTSSEPQINVRIGDRNQRRNRRVVRRTRISPNGRRVVRTTRVSRNGRRVVTRTRVVRRPSRRY